MTDDELLEPRRSDHNEVLRAGLLARTSGQIRRARRARIVGRIGICLVCFAAGTATMSLRQEQRIEVVYVQVRQEEPAPKASLPQQLEKPKSPAEIELAAEQISDQAEAARRFREAGDRYLRDQANYQAALRCYRNFLDYADPADTAASDEDTWLLTSLKRAREQENSQ